MTETSIKAPSIACTRGKHHNCRPGEWSCSCVCHELLLDGASTASVMDGPASPRPAGAVDGLAGSSADALRASTFPGECEDRKLAPTADESLPAAAPASPSRRWDVV